MIRTDLTPDDYIAIFRRRWVLITIFAFSGTFLAYGVSRFLPNQYKSQTLVLVEQPTVPTEIVKPMDTTDISQRLASMQQQILSRTRLVPIIHRLGLYPNEIDRVPMTDLVARLQKAIDVRPVLPMAETRAKDLPGFYVSATMDSPRNAQSVCTAVTSMFIEENLRLRQQHSEDTTQFLTQQLMEAKAKLDEQDARLAAFKSRYIGSLPDQEKTNLDLLAGLSTQLDASTQALSRAQQDKSFAESMLAQQIAAWHETKTGLNPETLETQLLAMQTQLADLQAKYTNDHPDVVKMKESIAALQKQVVESEKQRKEKVSNENASSTVEPIQITQLRAQIHAYDQVIGEKLREEDEIKQQIKVYRGRVESSPAIEQQYKQLTRDYQTALDFYNDLLKKRDVSAMAHNLELRQQGEQFNVLDPPNLPDSPSFPDRRLFALGGFVGGLSLGIGLAFLFELHDSSLKTESDIEFVLHLPVLASIPAIKTATSKKESPPDNQLPVDSGVGVGTGG